MFNKVLIANRGEVAVRILRTLKRLGVASVAVYAPAEAGSLHVRLADEAIALPGDSARESYLNVEAILAAAKASGAEAIIPGYGFLAENAAFARACAQAGVVFVGPTPEQLEAFGLKHRARELAQAAGVPLAPGSGLLRDLAQAQAEAAQIGYPVMLKTTAGGGGIGMRRCDDAEALSLAFTSVQAQGESFFADGGVFLERFVERARHVEVQIFGDGRGGVVALGERDCSLQRRNQKVIEETPAPRLPEATRETLLAAAVRLGQSVHYASAGTVEFVYDERRDAFYFLEVNARLQVEHPVTEMVTGIDLVAWMLQTAAGTPPDLNQPPLRRGVAIEARLYAEDPLRDFQPAPGELTEVVLPEGEAVRVDHWIDAGTEVTSHFDPMLGKVIAWGEDRPQARARLQQALDQTVVAGTSTNLDFLRQVVAQPFFAEGQVHTGVLRELHYQPPGIEVLAPGTYTTLQDYPGRLGLWHIGVPPSGPMDPLAFRLGNRIVGNHPDAAGLECTLIGPSLKFHVGATVAITGAPVSARVDGQPVPCWVPVSIRAGQVLELGRAEAGCRTYLAVREGFDVPEYLHSRATFALGQFGGLGGRTLRVGDLLPIGRPQLPACRAPAAIQPPQPAPPALIPDYAVPVWRIGVLYGPHGAPDFFTPGYIDTFFATEWEVHYNSNRLGIRLIGPKPEWTRSDGGEAGLHPSNIHDTTYAIGSVNFTGDMPVILTQDGPSLGGFVCPVTIVKAELWKVGQLRPGDRVQFVRIDFDTALALERAQDQAITRLEPVPPVLTVPPLPPAPTLSPCILADLPPRGTHPEVAYRQAGDKYVLIEYGQNVLDLRLRFRVHALMEALSAQPITGVEELSPGVRSLQVRYDSRLIHQHELIQRLMALEHVLPPVDAMQVPSRTLYLPMAYEDSATLDAVARYRQSVRATAPWLPSNTEFMSRINGLERPEQVPEVIFSARYLVLGLGDVYLGAPCAVPVDPRHRLLTSKYNPARTYTAEGTVGIGGVYMCVYGMDSPGGYQLVGRTLPIWNKFGRGALFSADAPWLLRFFDQVRFFPVTEDELDRQRAAFRAGRLPLRVEHGVFDLSAHEQMLITEAADIERFQTQQQDAFMAEVARWQADTESAFEAGSNELAEAEAAATGEPVTADLTGNIWRLLVAPGQTVAAGEPLLIIEAMKMEFTVHAHRGGTVAQVCCAPGRPVRVGEVLVTLELEAG